MGKRYLYIPFIRQDGLEVNTLAVVKVEAMDFLSAEDAVEALQSG